MLSGYMLSISSKLTIVENSFVKTVTKACLSNLLFICIVATQSVAVAEPVVVRLGTGGSGGTYFPMGSLIAKAISGPAGIHKHESFFEAELFAIAQRGTGSASNVKDISEGFLEAGLAQADVVHWAFTASGPFENKPRCDTLRGLATLYMESVHLIARADANITTIEDLKNKRVSMDEQGSGTQLDMLHILAAYGLSTESFDAVYLKPADAIDRLRRNELDAFFIIAGYPVAAVSNLVDSGQATIVSINGEPAESLIEKYPFFSKNEIPENTYKNTGNIETLGVPAQLIIDSNIDEELVYNITSMLWSNATEKLLDNGHPKGKEVRLESALTGMNIPLHPGAARFYTEQGMLNER